MIRRLFPRLFGHLTAVAALLGLFVLFMPPAMAAGAQPPGVGQDQAGQKAQGKNREKPAHKRVKKDKAIRGEYIVVLDDDVIGAPGDTSPAEQLADALVATYGGKVKKRFKHAINGFLATMTEAQAEAMSQDSLVAYVEDDSEVALTAVQSGATWGLDRIDQRPRALNGSYSYSYMGAGVTVYVVDTGINTSHVEFGGRAFAAAGWDFTGDGWNGLDCTGHGTHVAGTIGGNTVGVAKRATLVSVRVFDCAGKTRAGAITTAVDTITAYARKPAVVNMSLTAGVIDPALDTAIGNSVKANITYFVAAGNSGVDACLASPAHTPGTITVGATDWNDQRAVESNWSSNWGSCVDLWAPGRQITSASHLTTTGTAVMGGTSMASPHVAGAAAIYLSAFPTATPATVRSVIVNTATVNLLTGIGTSSPNKLLYSLMQY